MPSEYLMPSLDRVYPSIFKPKLVGARRAVRRSFVSHVCSDKGSETKRAKGKTCDFTNRARALMQ